jgi:hypothetical protein
MNAVRIAFTIPSFLVWAFVIALEYLGIGLLIGIIQNIWVSILSDAKQDNFFTSRRLFRIIGIMLLWPNDLVVQFRIKVLGTSEEKVCRLSGSSWASTLPEINQSVKGLRAGQEVKATWSDWSEKDQSTQGKVTRRFSLANCSTLSVNGHTLRLSNGKASINLTKPVEVLV